ncbi:hypothetical protein PLICRDRAFT_604896 [Plicaturopsis crispa FD-325 SS-3]|nr:hypothetical protein PLICRDRAFT_604896 [Plicaturopsis crispa FD-325 SS-3]
MMHRQENNTTHKTDQFYNFCFLVSYCHLSDFSGYETFCVTRKHIVWATRNSTVRLLDKGQHARTTSAKARGLAEHNENLVYRCSRREKTILSAWHCRIGSRGVRHENAQQQNSHFQHRPVRVQARTRATGSHIALYQEPQQLHIHIGRRLTKSY